MSFVHELGIYIYTGGRERERKNRQTRIELNFSLNGCSKENFRFRKTQQLTESEHKVSGYYALQCEPLGTFLLLLDSEW